MFVDYVIVDEFARKAIGDDKGLYMLYKGINTETFEYTTQVLGYSMLTPEQFEENFELFMDQDEIRHKLEEMES